jgi:NAD(P)-dependent dehydrogenase (short-subunit alcohol dehydrogenase family)
MRLDGKVALITGAGSGMGRAAALLFAAEGARVGALDLRPEQLDETVTAIRERGGEALALPADVSRPEQLHDAVERLVGAWGRLDTVFANAGINGVWAPIDEIEPDEWDRTLAINLKGTYLTFKYTVPYLKRQGGAVVITSSVQGTRVFSPAGSTAYACSKAAQVTLMKKMALELAKYGVRVNAVCPGATDTSINQTTEQRSLDTIEIPITYHAGRIPLTGGKRLEADQIARLALFLCSDEAAAISGTEVWIDGALSLLVG